jgi:hypothetical protein
MRTDNVKLLFEHQRVSVEKHREMYSGGVQYPDPGVAAKVLANVPGIAVQGRCLSHVQLKVRDHRISRRVPRVRGVDLQVETAPVAAPVLSVTRALKLQN